MYGPGLKKLAAQWDMKPSGGMLCGVVQGFPMAMNEGTGYKLLTIHLGNRDAQASNAPIDPVALLNKPIEQYRIRRYEVEDPFLIVEFSDNPGTIKLVREYIEVEMPRLREAGFSGADDCFQCHEPMNGEAPVLFKMNDCPIAVHRHCAGALESEIAIAQAKEDENQPRSGLLAPLGALLGGLIASIPWIALYVFGYIASLAAILIALGAGFGHRLFGGKPGPGRFALIVVITLLVVLVAQVAGVVCQLGYDIHTGELQKSWEIPKDALALEDTLPLLSEMLNDPEIRSELLSAYLKELLMAYLFAALGLWGIWSRLKKENLPGRVALSRVM